MPHLNHQSYLKWAREFVAGKKISVPKKINGADYDRKKDREIYQEFKTLTSKFTKTYPLHTITNEPAEQKKFLRAFYQNKIYNPDFHYKQKSALAPSRAAALVESLESMAKKLNPEEALGQLYHRRIFDAEKAIILNSLSQRRGFDWASRAYYHPRKLPVVRVPASFRFPLRPKEHIIEAYEVAYLAQKILVRLGLKYRARITRRRTRFRGMATAKSKIGIGPATLRSPAHMIRSLAHEILGHAIAGINARKYPAFFVRASSTSALCKEEGLAVKLGEFAYLKLKNLLPARMRSKREDLIPELRLAAITKSRSKSFYETFKYLNRDLKINDYFAWELATRAKRGVADQSAGGANYHDILYFTGREKINALLLKKRLDFKKTISLLNLLNQGKFDLAEWQLLKKHFPAFQTLDLNHYFALFCKELGEIIQSKFSCH
ncbi:MAG: DUF1704 domain-containing protein [bacterium]|nr:DUF1704 domain-containing protein [bacterium]